MSASFAVDVWSPAVVFSAANLLEYVSNDPSVGSVPVFDVYFDLEEKVACDMEGDTVESDSSRQPMVSLSYLPCPRLK